MAWWRRREKRSLTLGQLVGGTLDETPPSFADVGRRVDPGQALRLSAVWASVRLLADVISTLPLDVYRSGDRDPLPLPPVLVEPAAGTPRHDWLYQVLVSLLLRGNCYGLVVARDSVMRPRQIELTHPDLWSVIVSPDGNVVWRYRGAEIDRRDLWHVRAYPFPGSPTGLSPITYGARAVGLGLAADRYAGQYFEEGAHPTGLLKSDQRLTSDDADAAKARFVASTRGKREPVVLGQGLTFDAIQVSPADAQLLELQRFTVAQVARLFGVPPEMIGAESGGSLTYANVESRDLAFAKYALTPWLVRLEMALGDLLPRGQHTRFNVDGLLRATTLNRYRAHEIALRAQFLTVDEVRALEDLPPMAAG